MRDLIALLPFALIAIALLLAWALRVACRWVPLPSGGYCAGLRGVSSPSAGDPYLFPFGDVTHADREIANYRRELRADDFRARGLPAVRPAFGRRAIDITSQFPASSALRRTGKGSDGRLHVTGSAVVLAFSPRSPRRHA
ncbi:hypothetical protein JQ594_15350 [Bradyrhizobium manausense]|uniref:hypothetical protein n=1 Tax=Bradyrhizobium manausense TaxID=989370 RepID=UPI001BABF70A|nr:hypothetical protein [Bradyrhizobium manausense]MBR0687306.1 hypothetical protein [Bradyrhizobium manausense]